MAGCRKAPRWTDQSTEMDRRRSGAEGEPGNPIRPQVMNGRQKAAGDVIALRQGRLHTGGGKDITVDRGKRAFEAHVRAVFGRCRGIDAVPGLVDHNGLKPDPRTDDDLVPAVPQGIGIDHEAHGQQGMQGKQEQSDRSDNTPRRSAET